MNNHDSHCGKCVYYITNLDRAQYAAEDLGTTRSAGCFLDFSPGDDLCREMMTDNCSMRKSRIGETAI